MRWLPVIAKWLSRRWTLLWLALIILTILFLVQAGLVLSFSWERASIGLPARSPVTDQVAALIEMIDDGTPAQRERVLRIMNGPAWSVKIHPSWPKDVAQGAQGSVWLGDVLRGYLPPDKTWMVDRMAIWYEENQLSNFYIAEAHLVVPLTSGEALRITARDTVVGRLAALWTMAGLGLIGAVLAIGTIIMARRVTAPLAHVAKAADQIGMDIHSAPLPDTGPGELRTVAKAFNTMQARIIALLAERTRMLSGIAHDLRTVLTRQRLRAESLPDPVMRAKAIGDFDFMLRVIDTHLDFARQEALQEPSTRLDLASVIRDLCEDAALSGAKAEYTGPDFLAIEGRPAALRRALSNLIDNAIHYGGEADVELRQTGSGVEIDVRDRGPGIAVDKRKLVFEPYQRAVLEGRDEADEPHFGLGLATVQAIVRQHAGTIEILDRPDGGTVFRMALP